VNEGIAEIAETLSGGSDSFEFLCECADLNCIEAITLTLTEYHRVAGSTSTDIAPT
jgi:hypothetical protein